MSRTNVDANTLAALAAAHVEFFLLIEMDFDSGMVYLCDLPFDITIGAQTYLAAQGIGNVEAITETDSEVRGLAFTLSAVNGAAISAALQEHVQGRAVTLKLVVVDAGTLRVDAAVWTGVMDVMTIEDGVEQPLIRVTAEHQMIAWQQPSGALFSDAELQRNYAGDKFFEYAPQVAEQTLVWPSAKFFKQ